MDEAQPDSMVAYERVYAGLSRGLASGRYRPGQRLTIRDCAKAFGVSAMPVREAFRRLLADGALEGEANRTTRVPLLTATRLREMRDIRVALEGLAAERATLAATPADVTALRDAAEAVRRARMHEDREADMDGIRAFHFTLYAAARLANLQAMIANAWMRFGPYRHMLYPAFVTSHDGAEARARIVQAFAGRDALAVRTMICAEIVEPMTWAAQRLEAEGSP